MNFAKPVVDGKNHTEEDFSLDSRNNLINIVESAVKYTGDSGKEEALKEFN